MQLLDEETGGRRISTALQDTFNDTFKGWLPVLRPACCNSQLADSCGAFRNGPAFGSVLLKPLSPSKALGCEMVLRRCFLAPQDRAPCFRPTSVKASTQRSMSSSLCTAEIWTRMRAFPLGTTG